MSARIPAPGLADPTRDAQRTFRALLDALAHPGTRYEVTGPASAPTALGPALTAVLLTLLDEQAPVHLAGALATDQDVPGYLAFHTGAPLADAAAASFVVARPADLPELDALSWGTDEAPHQSATVVVDAREAAFEPVTWVATGPGIRDEAQIEATWAPPAFREQRARMTAAFPRGVDLLVVDGSGVLGLPRTTHLVDAPAHATGCDPLAVALARGTARTAVKEV